METGRILRLCTELFPDNRVKQIREIGKPYKDESGQIVSMQGSIQDVTKEKEELNLSNSNKLLDESQSIAKMEVGK
jgi:hypothetical protein